jgi:hypothetical protein
MMGRRVLSLLVGLCAASAVAQTPPTLMATASLPLDGGASVARAYVVTGGNTAAGAAEYAMTNAGGELQVFSLADNTEQTPLPGVYATFAVADYVTVGAGMTTLVVAADVSPSCPTVCLDIFFWDPVGGFVSKGSALTNVTGPTAMTIDASSSPIRIFFTIQGTTSALVEQDVTISALGAVSLVGVPTSVASPSANTVEGLTVDSLTTVLFASDNQSNVYEVPEDGGTNVLYATALTGGYSQVRGLFFYPYPLLPPASAGTPYLLAGSGVAQQGIYALNPNLAAGSNITIGNAIVLTADAGRATLPSGASVNAFAGLTLVTEDATNDGGPPWLHVISSYTVFPDGGPADAGSSILPPFDAGVDAGTDAGTLPTIPVIAPGPGVAPPPTNSCNCSTAGSAPMLLVLLLPLLVPRRRR